MRLDASTLAMLLPDLVETGSLPLRVENPGGLSDVQFGRLLVLEAIETAVIELVPEFGPRVGGTYLSLSADRDVFAPGARVGR